jgi:hypothetical protein
VYVEPSHWLHEISLSETVCHHFLPGLTAHAKNGDKQFWKEKFHAIMMDPDFVFFSGWVDRDFSFFPLFPMCSHQVSNGFPEMFPMSVLWIWFA